MGSRPWSCPLAGIQVVLLFFFSSPFHFLKRHFTASICSLLLPSSFVSSLEMVHCSSQILITVSMGGQTPNKDTDFAPEALSFHHPEENKREGD